MVVFKDKNYLPNLMRTIRLTQRLENLNLKNLKVDWTQVKGNIHDIVDKERFFFIDFTELDPEEDSLQNSYLEYCRSEDAMYFETKLEFRELKYSKDIQELFYDDYN